MTYIYPAEFAPSENGGYIVLFKDLDLATEGENLSDAITMAEEALTLRLTAMERDGDEIPVASKPEYLKPEEKDGFITLVHTDKRYLMKEKCVKKNLTIPSWLADKADDLGINYSQTLQDALKEKVAAMA